jgi:surfeit locus 1 family protein
VRLRLSRERVFAPSLRGAVAVLLLCVLFVCLGMWQWHRGIERQVQWTRFARGAERVQELGTREVTALPLFQRVSVTGELDGAHQFLLDNRSYRGRPGYEVLTPLERPGAAALLIDRGWVPFSGRRAQLPDVSLPAGAPERTPVTLTGRLAALPSPGLASGRAPPDPRAPWPKLASFPRIEELAAVLGAPLAPRILLLDPKAPEGYVRDWQPPGMTPLRHFSYAIQWWSFAALAVIVWLSMSARRAGTAEET